MKPILVCSAVGSGPTELAAFDAALLACGAADRNLIRLSSVIPVGADIARADTWVLPGAHGDRLYAVWADQRSSVTGTWVGAGIGWARADDGRGWFVEHETVGTDRAGVERDLRALIGDSLLGLHINRSLALGKVELEVVVGEVRDDPVCALALAVYDNEGWVRV